MTERADDAKNLVMMLQSTVHTFADKEALLSPNESGGYDTWTYQRMWSDIESIALNLQAKGVQGGDRVGLLSDGRAAWPLCDFAILSLGACTVPIYPSIPPQQIEHIVRDSGMKGLFLEDVGQLKKLLQIPHDEVPQLQFVVLLEPDDTDETATTIAMAKERYDVYLFSSWTSGVMPKKNSSWRAGWQEIDEHHLATIVYTSGTTGLPKGVLLTHGNLLANVRGIRQVFELRPTDRTLSYLPLSHIFERTAGQFVILSAGGTIVYSRGFSYITEDFLRMPPTVFTTVPRLLEKVLEITWKKVEASPNWRKRLFQNAVDAGMKARVKGERVLPIKVQFYDRLVFSQIKAALGGRLRAIISGGAPLPKYVGEFFTAAGIAVAEGYGMTETSPVVCVNPPGAIHLGTAGKILPNVEVRIAEDGEVLVKGPSITKGYHNNEDATRNLFTEDGWMHTGDIGEVTEDGYLRITDRKKNLIVLSTGKKVTPAPIEGSILKSRLIDQALLIGQAYKFVSLIVVPNEDEVREWYHSRGQTPLPRQLWQSDKALYDMLMAEVQAATDGFAEFERPKKLLILEDTFTVENGCLTPTLKVKARVVLDKYEKEIEALYVPSRVEVS
ncbi:long-chain fatty acid--CoA ligase [Alicyclobacillus curvatus]|nr:long-chain fatty acid--CoA ligase [Alicyclobacillus curvatus]